MQRVAFVRGFMVVNVTSALLALPGALFAQAPAQAPAPSVVPRNVDLNAATEFGYGIFQQKCLNCHGKPEFEKAPPPAALYQYTPERIYESLTTGPMASVIGNQLSDAERKAVAETITSQRIGAAGSSSQCPVEPPSQLAPCNFVVGQCNYAIDKCSSASFECLNGAWFQAPRVGGASYDCASFQAPNLPKDGDSCECLGQLDCTFNDCADRGQLHAICDNATWHVKESACAGPPCGPSSSCALGDICIVHVGFGPTFSCVPNECARLSKPVSCDCAGSACAKSEGCSIDSGALVCSCPTCI